MTAAPSPQVDEFERSERLRAKLERRFRVTPAMLHSINMEGRLISVSDAWLAKLGYARDEVLGRPSSDFLTPESREHAIKNVLPEFYRSGRCENVEYQMVCNDGRIIDVLLSAILDIGPTKNQSCSLAVVTDVTDRKAIERRLAKSEARYRRLVEDQSEFVSLATPEGELTFVNRAYAQLHQKQPDEIVGTSLFDLVPEERRKAVATHLQRVCSLAEPLESENQVVLPNRQTRWITWTNRAVTDAAGKVTAIHSVGRDIERRVSMEQRLKKSEAGYRLLAENSTDMILLVRHDGTRLYASPACRALLGYEPEEVLGMSTADSVHPDDFATVLACLERPEGERTILTYRMRRKDGSYVWVESVTQAIVDEAGQPPQRLVIARDIEQRVATERRLQESEARYRLLAENSTDMVIQLDLNLVRTYVSPASREIFGYEPEDLLGGKSGGMAHPEDEERLAEVLQTLIEGRADRHSAIARRRHRDGRWIWVEARYRALKDPKTQAVTGIIGTVRDISARKAIEDKLAEANRRLEALAHQDWLTGLANRRSFDEALSEEYKRERRDRNSLGLLMLDVDFFKSFNDRYGHPAGDECLKRISEAITNALFRLGDMVARYGGEEFVVLLPDTDELGAAMIGERIRQAVLLLAIEHDASPYRVVTVSVGVASIGKNAFEGGPETLLECADRALYCAKDSGRNAVVRASHLSLAQIEKSPTAA